MFKMFIGLLLNFFLISATLFTHNAIPVITTPAAETPVQKIPAPLLKEITDFVAEAHKKGLSDEEILVMCQQLLKTVGEDVLGHPLTVEIQKTYTWLNSKVVAACFTVIVVIGCITLLSFLMHGDKLESNSANAQVTTSSVIRAHDDLARTRGLMLDGPIGSGLVFSDDEGEVVGLHRIDAETQVGKTHPMITRTMDGTRKAKVWSDEWVCLRK